MKFRHKKLAEYEYVEDIGSGGQGRVVKVKEKEKDRYYALKVLTKIQEINQFKKEIEIMKEMSHKNIVPMYDASVEEGEVFILMKYMKDGNVIDYINNNNTISLREKLLFIKEVAEALKHLHGKKYIHRDVKPNNIFVTDDGSGEKYACLGDFGIAKYIGKIGSTKTTELNGTYMYLPLEILKEEKKYTEKTDIYSLGISMYEILTGRHPYDSCANILELAEKLEQDRGLIKPSVYNSDIKRKVDEMCLKSISKKKEQQYNSISDFLHDIKLCLELYPAPNLGNDNQLTEEKAKKVQEKVKKSWNFSLSNFLYNRKKKVLLNQIKKNDDRNAMLKLARLYFYGNKKGERNQEKGIEYYHMAFKKGSSEAMIELARIYLAGKDVNEDIDRAVDYYEKAIVEDDRIEAMFELGEHYLGIEEEDKEKALSYLEMAANKGSLKAYEKIIFSDLLRNISFSLLRTIREYCETRYKSKWANLTELYMLGKIYEYDRKRMMDYYIKYSLERPEVLYSKGKKQKDKNCTIALAEYYCSLGNYEEAIKAYKEIKDDYEDALWKIGEIYMKKNHKNIDYDKAIHWLERAEEKGSIVAIELLEELYEIRGLPKDKENAEKYGERLLRIVKRTDAFRLGRLFSEDSSERLDYKKAIQFYKEAANQGSTRALEKIGAIYTLGEYGVKKNYLQAVRYYEAFIEKRYSPEVRHILSVLYEIGGYGLEKDRQKASKYDKMNKEDGKYFKEDEATVRL